MGASPDAGNAYSPKREKEIWNSLEEIIHICNEESVDVLLIAGDLFHRQPLLRELKEVNYLFTTLEETKVVLIAGNHDYIKKDSYYLTFQWSENVYMLQDKDVTSVEFPELSLAVYGCSYHAREILESVYDNAFPQKKQPYEILLAHGGDEKHIPIQSDKIKSLGYDYIALGHIHKPQIIEKNVVAYAGALEPIDKNDVGAHGYIMGEIVEGICRVQFIPIASGEYIHMDINVNDKMTGYELKELIRTRMKEKGIPNIYKITLKGYHDPDIIYDLASMDSYGNIVEIKDETRPAYNFGKLLEQNKENLLGKFIECLTEYEEDSVEYQALCEGVQALMETRRG